MGRTTMMRERGVMTELIDYMYERTDGDSRTCVQTKFIGSVSGRSGTAFRR